MLVVSTFIVPGIDLLLSRYFANEIKNSLKPNQLKKVEHDLFFVHGMSIKLAMEHFDQLHKLLKSTLEIDSKNFEKSCLSKIISLRKHNENYLIEILHPELACKLLDYLGDQESRKILACIMDVNFTIPEILSKTKVLKSPGYRKIENMLLDGIIIESGKIFSNKKRVSRYRCIFKEIYVIFSKNHVTLEGTIRKNDLESSSIFKFGV